MKEVLNEPLGFKVLIGGFTTWITSLIQGADLTQVVGFIALVVGLFIQVVSHYRNKQADQRDKEADARNKLKYDLEMKVLAKELQEVEARLRISNGES